MPTVELSKQVVERLMGKTLPLDRLKDRISMLGTDLEAVEGDAIRVEIFPNRPDMLSEAGFARALGAFIAAKPGLRPYAAKPSRYEVLVEPSVQKVRPYTACAVVTGLTFTDERIREMIQLQEKLHTTFCRDRKKAAIGIYPMEKIAWPVRYLAADPKSVSFVPLESGRKMTGLQVLSQHPAGRAYAHLLEGKGKFPFFIDAKNEVLSMPPIINSHLTGRVTEKTADVFIETSGFDIVSQGQLLNIIVTAFADMGGTVHRVKVRYPAGYAKRLLVTPDLSLRRMGLSRDYVNRLLGLSLTEKEIAALLALMGFGFAKGVALIPAYRADILHPIDLVEDVAIAYGYENFLPELPNVSTVGEAAPFSVFQERVASLMAGLGLLETHTYHISSKDVQCDRMGLQLELVELDTSANAEFSVMRASMLPSLLSVLEKNRRHEYPQRLFEMGTVFVPDAGAGTDTGVREETRLAIVCAHQRASLTEARQLLDSLLSHLSLAANVSPAEHPSFIPGRAGSVSALGAELGTLGELHPQTLAAFGIGQPTAGFDISLTALFALIGNSIPAARQEGRAGKGSAKQARTT